MGDRCSMTLEIGGVIKDHNHLLEIVKAIARDYPDNMDHDRPEEDIRDHLLVVMADGWDERTLDFTEVNYARLDCVEKLNRLGIETYTTNSSGADYPSGGEMVWFENGEKQEFTWTDGDEDRIHITILEAILRTSSDVAADLKAAIDAHKALHNRVLQPLTAGSEELQKEVAVRAAKMRIGIK